MTEFVQSVGFQTVVWSAALAVLLAIGAYLISKVRAMRRNEPVTSEYLTKFRELHSRGQLSDEEFKSIKGLLAQRLQKEWTGNGDKG
jgi:uncharacterized membrane protein